ncbi:High affinity nitrate transporter 2.5 [Geodia barretti]|uniref:High affinity nitrate transporter 2.5 n=1 Tax=Geodia barretti TaxID=519541 RepID=A0AA35RCB1_GEOBA|nr:High affinity nitrate transporter 2.5 [Geodia barretti]
MRTFHLTWFAFFLAFFGWFGIAPMMALVRDDLGLTKTQIGNTIIASVAITILARLLIGWLCDRIGPRLAYSGLLVLGSIPVMCIGLAQNYETFLLFRLAIGVIGASFVITQYHTSVMFAPNVVGTANATTAGWGNMGGGVTQMVMPLLLTLVLMLGVGETFGWRVAMVIPGVGLFFTGFAYYFLTQDCPEGNYRQMRAAGKMAPTSVTNGSFMDAAKDYRVWALFVIYGACFGIELTINNIAALYYYDRFELNLATAGLIAGLFGLMNIFARTLGGFFGDKFGIRFGLKGRVMFMGGVLLMEGLSLVLFSQMATLFLAVGAMIIFSLFVQMTEGATFSVVPFINRKALGSVAGIVGAGGNAGAVAAGFLFRVESLTFADALMLIGIAVVAIAPLVFLVRFSPQTEEEERRAMQGALARRMALAEEGTPAAAD